MEYEKSFIEVQFPVSKISKESYKERKANLGQTLTGLGKWWGRKPLILVRAVLLGVLMPASDDYRKDSEIFNRIMAMDEEGLYIRKVKNISNKILINYLDKNEIDEYFYCTTNGVKYKKISTDQKNELQKIVFNRMPYDEKLKYCNRIEELKNISHNSWDEINLHLETNAYSIQELIYQLGVKRFGSKPIVGDCFSGGGSIPFECSRIGAKVYASDLNPVAMLLTWADLNITNKNREEILKLIEFQKKVYDYVEREVEDLKIEKNEQGHRADYYLYCNEVICPECGYKVPLAPSWIIGKGTKTVAILKADDINKKFNIDIISNADDDNIKNAEKNITIRNNNVYCPHCNNTTPLTAIRSKNKNQKEDGLRKWELKDLVPRENDIFQERLYCIRYTYIDEQGKVKKYYSKVTEKDLIREDKVKNEIKRNFDEWIENGYIPSGLIEDGDKTDEPKRTRGWQYWHQLFNPRQLLIHGLFMCAINKLAANKEESVVGLLGVHKLCDWNARLSIWNADGANEKGQQVFTNQALNTVFNYSTRTTLSLRTTWFFNINSCDFNSDNILLQCDARKVKKDCDIWITDPPYADSVNYHEISEFFLSWDKIYRKKIFPECYIDSKRVLAVKGVGEVFNNSMIEVYSNLANHMSNNGLQVVMFTHQDVKVWAELAMILWSSGLQVTAAWNIATETESGGLKDGNYVKGTVLLVLRKQTSEETAYLDELYPEIEEEVKNQIDTMRELDDKEDPNFSDPDYLLAAYAASLKVLTSYKSIEDIDVKYELSKNRNDKEETPIQKIINEAKKIAYDYLIPVDFDNYLWKELKPVERFYLKGLEFEMNNMCKLSGYQELAKGFGVNEYNWMLGSTKANSARVKTPKEFAMRNINDNSVFGQSLLRHVLASIYIALKEDDINKGLNWLKSEVNDYWNNRNMLVEILNYLSKVEVIDSMEHWKECAHEAFILKNLVENDSI
ncbi:anti-phage-associated DUF1156 domain-containing protein [uncultured Clostridium sp.]|uniref:anti-phage-associated DUF1156 domain-containing protein n=2 Tax=uncultured Clostridium sp. TaxID=59620 RepID=UPI002621ABA4|nr:anti-phage-associated DUF1156 domain-containing protein [uncultured Clostridium sp.]